MSSATRLIRTMLHTINLFYVLSWSLQAMATPIPLPLPLMAADYSYGLTSVNRTVLDSRRLSTFPIKPFTSHKRKVDSLSDAYTFYDGANTNANSLSMQNHLGALPSP